MFNEKIELLKNIFLNEYDLELVDNYDAFLIKKLANSNILKENRTTTSNQSHIAITGEDNFDFFPYINVKHYTILNQTSMKSFYYLTIPIKLFKKNIELLDDQNNFNFETNDYIVANASVKMSRPNSPQIELGNTTQSDKLFTNFRKLFFENDFMILLKVKDKLEYQGLIIKNTVANKYDLKNETQINSEGNSTKVNLTSLTEEKVENECVISAPPYSKQLIFSGAPGTGKSYALNKLANEYFRDANKTYYKRVTFHPNMNYGHFVGVYKPFPSNNESAPITYKFVPGVLLQQLIEAYKNPKCNYLVLIEEINRANTASVFGDTFQLLDRSNGESEYPIAISEDIRTYLEEQNVLSEELTEINDIKVKNKLENEGLYFPKNFYIWASMNEADQGVLPMDTAFKRRWDFEKFDINDLGEEGEKFFSNKVIKTCNEAINWNKLRMAINSKLLDLNVPEGKLMGPYFISKDILEDEEKLTNAFETKVLMYLLEDAVKTRPTALFAIENSEKHYGALVDKFNELGIAIFRDIDLSNDIVPLEEVLSEGLETTNLISEFDINKYEDGLEFNQKDILTYLIEESNKLSDTKVLDNVQGSNGLYFIEAKMDIPEKQAGKNKYLHVKNSSFKGSGNVTICLRVPYEEAKEYPNTTMTTGNPGKFTTEIELKSKEDVDSIIELIEKSIDYTSSLYK